jgi:integrase/recombinase XerC
MDAIINTQVQSALTVAEPTLDQAAQTFLRRGLVGKTEKTHEWYRKRLTGMVTFLGSNRPANSILSEEVEEWYVYMSEKREKWGGGSTHPTQIGKLSPSYLHGLVRATRTLFRWLQADHKIEADPSISLKLPKIPKTGRKGISDADALKIIDRAKTGLGDGLAERDYALIRFLESTGARLGGITSLHLVDLNLDAPDPECRRATVCEKGDKERTVCMTPGALAALRAWLAVRPEIEDDHVFLGRTQAGDWHALTGDGVYQVLERYAVAVGLKKIEAGKSIPEKGKSAPPWSPHQWRHRYGRKLAQSGMSLGTISQLMGHEDVTITVKFYGIFSMSEQQNSYDRYMPDF